MKLILKNSIPLFVLVTFVLMSCKTQKVSTIVGFDYDKTKNQTDYFVLPYGSVSIPNKWEKVHYNSSSKQQFFKNSDSVIIAVAFGACYNFEFNADQSKIGFEFTKAYYEWDSQYFVKNLEMTRELIEQDSTNNFIVWRFYGKLNEKEVDTFLLFGEKNCKVTNYSVFDTDKWTRKQKINFLKSLFLSDKV